MPSRLPLIRRCCLNKQSLELGHEHLSTYQSPPRRPRCELFEPLKSSLLQSEICLSPPQEVSMKRQSLPLVLLLPQAKFVKVAVQQVEAFSEPKNQAQRRLCELAWDHEL